MNGRDITIFEESGEFGGALDAHGNGTEGYFMSGSRMFEAKYTATFDLRSFIPSISNPDLSIKAETDMAAQADPWYAHARLVDREGKVVNAHPLGFSERIALSIMKPPSRPTNTCWLFMARPKLWAKRKISLTEQPTTLIDRS